MDGTGAASEERRQSLFSRFKAAAKRLKREVLVLHYALKDERVGWLPRVLGGLALAYALSPIDLIPDFIPVLGLLDDLILLPGLIWLAMYFVPQEVMDRARARASEEPLRLSKNWVTAVAVLTTWNALFLSLVFLGLQRWCPGWRLKGVAATAVALITVEAVWAISELRQEKLRASRAQQPLLASGTAPGQAQTAKLEEGKAGGASP
mmetsp:Transcript_20708/g.42974  ORF Transcript_20708/g.42974 Transcript_20708/m.42974 type:complete len:207 (-) Transcript_20708:265-885(-)